MDTTGTHQPTTPSPAPAAQPAHAAAHVPTHMRAVVHERYGDADVLRVSTEPTPTPGPGEVLLEVHAAGLDRGTWHVMTGLPHLVRLVGFGLTRPRLRIPGMDVAGRVVVVGEGVTDLAVGDEVLGVGIGTWAEYARARADKLVRRPARLTVEQAAALAISGLTAYQAVHDVGRVQGGQRVLVLGASGGVGSHAVQLARAAGARVTGVASAAKADLVRDLGAQHVVDHATEDALDGSTRYDLVVDTGGRASLRRLRRALTPTGTLVLVGGEGGGPFTGGFGRQLRAPLVSLAVRQRLVPLMSKESRAGLERLTAAVERGDVTPAVGATYPLERAADAMRDLVAGRARGKSVIVVRSAEPARGALDSD
ncbi:NAD(P)-dependent alcohol dehydrogenase [Actinotalea sp. AC32]|nr:NAD(P)-dependent alcohol dehydrogenase [Actinotalea sp. AC32]